MLRIRYFIIKFKNRTKYALGYSYFYYVNTMYKKDIITEIKLENGIDG
ncbi:MAG: hypothetical protein IJX34_03695 [Clostridia bacterium]|nr:hypothetical protein [Clostridia bacterium]